MANMLRTVANIVDGAFSIKRIATTINSSGILNGINVKDIDPNNLGAIGEKIKSNITSSSDSIMGDLSGLSSSFDTSSMEKVMSSIELSDVGIDTSELEKIPGFDKSMLEGISFK